MVVVNEPNPCAVVLLTNDPLNKPVEAVPCDPPRPLELCVVVVSEPNPCAGAALTNDPLNKPVWAEPVLGAPNEAPNAGRFVDRVPNAGGFVVGAPNVGRFVEGVPNAGGFVVGVPNTGVFVAGVPNAGADMLVLAEPNPRFGCVEGKGKPDDGLAEPAGKREAGVNVAK